MEVKVLIFAEDSTSQKLFPLLQDEEIKVVGRVNDENKILDTITKFRPDVVLISSNNINLLLRVCQQVYLLRPRSVPVVITEDYNNDIIKKIMPTGVHYILPIQIDKVAFIAQLKGIQSNESSRMIALENTSTADWKSKVITVFSSKGGVGRTTVAINLAVQLAKKKRKVAILDFDLEFGEVASSMRIETKDTISELLQEQTSPNADTIRKYMTMHSSGISVLAAPASPEFSDHISSSQVEKIVSVLRTYYDYLIIDTSMGFNSVNLSCFDASSLILYVTGMDLATLRRTKKGLSILNSLVGDQKIRLLVAKEELSRVKTKDVSKSLEFPLWHAIPFEQKISLEAINQGVPIVLDSPMSKVSKSYHKMADKIDGSDSQEEKVDRSKSLNILLKKNKSKKGDN